MARKILTFVFVVTLGASTWGQDTPQISRTQNGVFPDLGNQPQTTEDAKPTKWTKGTVELTDDQAKDAKTWLENLTSREFAVRERAAENLLGLGGAVVPLMRKKLAQISHPEAKMRLSNLISQLNQGNLDQRLEAFARGEDVGFEGWRIFRIIFGPSGASRDLFVELKLNFPTLVDAFDGTPRDLAMAMDDVIKALIAKQKKLPAPWTVADAVALLLPVGDDRVPLSEDYEEQMMRILQQAPASQTPRDPLLGRPYVNLLNAWVRRSTLGNRERVLNFAIQQELTGGYPLAKKTLTESNDPRTIAMAMQVISVYGRQADSQLIASFLKDERKLAFILSPDGKPNSVLLADAAIATIAKLHGMSLMDLGHPRTAEHVRYGFIYEQLTYQPLERANDGAKPIPMAKQRDDAKQKIKALLEPQINEEDELKKF